jgi:acetyltransferase-like isoleucine patch superfamily enzyme
MSKFIYSNLLKASKLFEFIYDQGLSLIYKKSMKSCGKNVRLKPSTSVYFGLENLSIGNDVSIPRYSHIFCTDAPLKIGNKVIFGPSPTIVTGNHRIDVVGKYIVNSIEKSHDNDQEVIIEDDVWVGANVTILKGVIVGRGSVVAAGAVLNKVFPPYSIIGGVPAKVLKFRFTIDEIIKHELALYPVENRLKKETLNYIKKQSI